VAISPVSSWQRHYDELEREGRARTEDGAWVSNVLAGPLADAVEDDEVAATMLRVHLGAAGPVFLEELVGNGELGAGPLRGAPLSLPRARTAMARLEATGFAMAVPDGRWCARHTFARLNRMARQRRRAGYAAVPVSRLVDFLVSWQRVLPEKRLAGREGVRRVIEQLQGVEVAAGEWERSVLAARVVDYRPEWLDELCLSGEVTWARLTPRLADPDARGASTPSAATPLALLLREDLDWQLRAVRLEQAPPVPSAGAAAEVLEVLAARGAQFRSSLPQLTGRLAGEVDEGVWDLVSRGLVSADAYSAVRSLLSARQRLASRGRGAATARRLSLSTHRAAPSTGVGEGRWWIVGSDESALSPLELESLAEQVAIQLIVRWGIVAYELYAQESYRVPWRYVAWALRRLEARGEVLGGRFVQGLAGEQFAHPDALDMLAAATSSEPVTLAACDPLNLSGGVVTAERVPARVNRRIALAGGDVLNAG
jgi:ATP-dependent Lhr-like helicase